MKKNKINGKSNGKIEAFNITVITVIKIILKAFTAGGAGGAFFAPLTRILPLKTRQKTCQIKLKRYFGQSGTHFARLINNPDGDRAVPDRAFPRTGHFSDSGNYIKSYQQSRKTNKLVLLKKLSKLTYQSRSNYSAITARLRQYLDYLKKQEELFFESNPAGNISQQQSDHRHTERDLGQNNSISQINHNFSNNFAVFTASNQLNITKMALADDATFKLAEDIFINSIYHHPCD